MSESTPDDNERALILGTIVIVALTGALLGALVVGLVWWLS